MYAPLRKLLILDAAFVATALGTVLSLVPALAASPVSLKQNRPSLEAIFTSRPVYPGLAWETATPEEVGMDPVRFAEAMALLPSPSVVIRHGKIVGAKGDITRSAHIFSASKSLTALIAARLMQQGKIDYDTLVPGSDMPSEPLASLRQFMSMTSDFGLSPHSPGNHYAYNNAAVNHYGDYLKNTYFPDRNYVEMLQSAYLTAIGAEDTIGFDGYISGWDGGWAMSTRDLARVGYLVLRNGTWNGEQLLPGSFIRDLYQNQVPDSATSAPDESDSFYNELFYTSHLAGAYSFGFWLPHRGAYFAGQSGTEAIAMSGALGTTVFISRTTDLVIAAVNTSLDHAEEVIISSAMLDRFAEALLFKLAASVSAASYLGAELAPESIVSAFGAKLATGTQYATSIPLPPTLAGTTVQVVDSLGTQRQALLFYVSPTQVNYQMPPDTALGPATVRIEAGDGTISAGQVQVVAVAPGLFTATSDGKGLATAYLTRVKADGMVQNEALARFDLMQNKFVLIPIDLTPGTDQVFLVAFGTGLRSRSSLANTVVKIGGVRCRVDYVGPAPGYVGLDQVNILLDSSLAGKGEVDVSLTLDGKPANTVKINIK